MTIKEYYTRITVGKSIIMNLVLLSDVFGKLMLYGSRCFWMWENVLNYCDLSVFS